MALRRSAVASAGSKAEPASTAKAEVDVRKFSEYALDPVNSNGKNVVFENLGYTKENASQLVDIYKQQGLENYVNGKYAIGKLDSYGQRITIPINLNGTMIKTGWMIEEYGIRLITPFAGFL